MATQYENISPALLWEVLRTNNAYLVKRKQAGGVSFSREPTNLLNKHSPKYAGFANHRAIGLVAGENGKVLFSTATPHKAHKPSGSKHQQSFGSGKSARGISKSVVAATARKGYRPDLRAAAVARASALRKSQRPVKEREPKSRGKKARIAAEKKE